MVGPFGAIPQDEAVKRNDKDPSGWTRAKEGLVDESFERCVLVVFYLEGMGGERHEVVTGIVSIEGFDHPQVGLLLLMDRGEERQSVGVEELYAGGCGIAQRIEHGPHKIPLKG